MYDLPSEDSKEPGLPDEFHDLQPQLLSRTLSLGGYSRDNCFTASDLNLYYTVRQPLWYKRPDWFLVVDVPRLYEQRDLRRSYVLWQEDHPPYIVVEFLSPGTEAEDLGRFYDETANVTESEPITPAGSAAVSEAEQAGLDAKPPGKFEVYETHLRVPHYFVYNRYTQCLRYFKLDGGLYQEQPLNLETPLVWLPDLNLGLGLWQGSFEGVTAPWLRWCDQTGTWLLTDTEQERQAKEQAQTQLLRAAQTLLATGMALEQVTQLLQLSAAQVEALNGLP
ncbi:hypothetical protein C7B82_24875 [Stenomitos frigidus ULC18]|uniref:Putative restriction endonuclease domain-containing protein n=2 Tax=Stenomitos TaxID=1844270 RepID=A0A2T1DX49_9CYAN|nr:hypothetical protein C7B82_24875 [Stenomitos frigidus ULC18]